MKLLLARVVFCLVAAALFHLIFYVPRPVPFPVDPDWKILLAVEGVDV